MHFACILEKVFFFFYLLFVICPIFLLDKTTKPVIIKQKTVRMNSLKQAKDKENDMNINSSSNKYPPPPPPTINNRENHRIIPIIALISIIALAVIGCKNDASPTSAATPVPQNKTFLLNSGAVNVTVNNYVLLSETAKSNLETVLTTVLNGNPVTGNLTINVIANGINGFASAGSKTLSVGASWIADKTVTQIGASIEPLLPTWTA
jgi:hypothetical protein